MRGTALNYSINPERIYYYYMHDISQLNVNKAALETKQAHRLQVYQLLCHIIKACLSNRDCTEIEQCRCSCHSLRNVMEVVKWLMIEREWGRV